ncbi:MAG: aminotransferase class I/II-fold pyridoxal phosphate-dependent enzyme, partial [Desulfobacterales bacterium]|nr:aminotransferase class I/II-fold pyridoxal phosphate-dependent enzyme [Desulfobacterales bacterium]
MTFLSDAKIVVKALDDYYRETTAGEKPVLVQPPLGELIADFDLASRVREGGLSGDELAKFMEKYLSSTTRLHHPGYMAHQVAAPHYAGALGSLVDGFTNNPMAIYEMGPGAASIEYFIVNWLLEKVGWRPSPLKTRGDDHDDPGEGLKGKFGGGVLTNGGSLANLTAMIAARNKVAPEVWEEGNPGCLGILAPAQCHYSIERAAGIVGLGRKAIYQLEVDEKGAVIPDRLRFAHDRLIEDGRRAMLLVANACSTPVGVYDPLQEIGDFCRERNIWFHVDGAHGAGALLSQRFKHRLKGVEKADSLTWDAHKMLRTPVLCAALLVREHETIDGAFEQEASYIFHEKRQPGFDFIHRTVECTKAGLGLRLFMVLAALGERGLADYIERQFDLTLEAYEYISGLPDFQCVVKPQSNILCLRIEGDDDLQLALRDRLTARGDFYISTTLFNGRRHLRLTLMSPDTRLDDIKRLVETL